MNTRLDIAQARTAPDAYRQQFLRLSYEQRSAHLQALDAAGLRAHAAATGEALTFWLFLRLGEDLSPREVGSGIADKRRSLRLEPGVSREAWFRPQHEFIEAAGIVPGICGVSLHSQLSLAEARPVLLRLLRDSLPAAGWHPTYIWLNTRGYSDRGEPPDPSTSIRIHGEVRWPEFRLTKKIPFQSTVTMIHPTDAEACRSMVGTLAWELGLRIEEV